MDFLKLAKDRYSVRSFKSTKIPRDILAAVLEAGRLAPTARNFQPQKIYVLESDAALAKLHEYLHDGFGAPTVLLVCADLDKAAKNNHDGRSYAEMDASIVTTHMMLEAASLGIGSTWVCNIDCAKAKEIFALGGNITPYCILPLGYPSDAAAPSPRHSDRKPVSETVNFI